MLSWGRGSPRASAILSTMANRYSTPDEIEALVHNATSESREIEFKLELPGSASDQKRKFLAIASSFANAVGGYVFFGIRAEKGIAKEICGISNLDERSVLQLDDCIRNGTSPRINSKFRIVECSKIVACWSSRSLGVGLGRTWSPLMARESSIRAGPPAHSQWTFLSCDRRSPKPRALGSESATFAWIVLLG